MKRFTKIFAVKKSVGQPILARPIRLFSDQKSHSTHNSDPKWGAHNEKKDNQWDGHKAEGERLHKEPKSPLGKKPPVDPMTLVVALVGITALVWYFKPKQQTENRENYGNLTRESLEKAKKEEEVRRQLAKEREEKANAKRV